MGWWIAIGFWVVGMAVMVGGGYLGHKLTEAKRAFDKKAESTHATDRDASIYFSMREELIDMMPWVSVRMITTIVGMVIFVFGFVAMAFAL